MNRNEEVRIRTTTKIKLTEKEVRAIIKKYFEDEFGMINPTLDFSAEGIYGFNLDVVATMVEETVNEE